MYLDGLEWEGVLERSEDAAEPSTPAALAGNVRNVTIPKIPDWWSGPK